MAIKITENGVVKYVNENDVDRTMFPNLTGAMGDEQYDALNGRLSVVEGKVTELEECCGDVNDEITKLKNDIASAFVTETVSGAIASFSDGADGVPIKSLVASIEPVQSGSGDPSPENVRPISGWTGANVTVNDEVLSVNWQTEAGTVYGGTLDVTTGVVTVDRAMVDLGTLSWGYRDDHPSLGAYFFADITSLQVKYIGQFEVTTYPFMCSQYKVTARDVTVFLNGCICADGSNVQVKQVQIKDLAFSNALTFKTAMSGVQLVYVLTQGQTYQLTPHEVSTILGQNNIFADTGNVTVQYRADTKLYIDKVLSQA